MSSLVVIKTGEEAENINESVGRDRAPEGGSQGGVQSGTVTVSVTIYAPDAIPGGSQPRYDHPGKAANFLPQKHIAARDRAPRSKAEVYYFSVEDEMFY